MTSLATKMKEDALEDFSVMRITGSKVLLMFTGGDACLKDYCDEGSSESIKYGNDGEVAMDVSRAGGSGHGNDGMAEKTVAGSRNGTKISGENMRYS
ncbi:hypothetical protein V6N13_047095 [Hibiscus sabdariffa]